MKVVIETPRLSFIKYKRQGDGFVREFFSPLPTLFNYGFVPGQPAADGSEKDAIVLGPMLRQGQEVEVKQLGVVRFIDDGLADDKIVTSFENIIGWTQKLEIHLFFLVYSAYKRAYYLMTSGRVSDCRYLGLDVTPNQ